MNERLIQFLAAENISQAQFADSINVARAGVSHIIAGRNKPSWDFILSTMKRYPTLNIEWLISGKGKMYKGAANAVNDSNGSSAGEYRTVNEVNTAVNGGYSPVNEGNSNVNENAVNGYDSGKMERNGLFDSGGLFGGGGDSKDGEIIEPEPIELDNSTAQTATQSVNQPATVYMTQQNTPQTVVKKPNVAKIIVFFDDGTFQECK